MPENNQKNIIIQIRIVIGGYEYFYKMYLKRRLNPRVGKMLLMKTDWKKKEGRTGEFRDIRRYDRYEISTMHTFRVKVIR